MSKIYFFLVALSFLVSPLALQEARAHCQIPCGIYGDHARIHEMEEHLETIKKAMTQVNALSSKQHSALDMNQWVRWVNVKEDHAQKIQNIVSEYFLAQRIKSSMKTKHYEQLLKLSHSLIQGAMKCKQTVDLSQVDGLRANVERFKKVYEKAIKK